MWNVSREGFEVFLVSGLSGCGLGRGGWAQSISQSANFLPVQTVGRQELEGGGCDGGGRFDGVGAGEVAEIDGGHLDMDVDPAEEESW